MLIYFLRIKAWFSLLFKLWSISTKVPKKVYLIVQLKLETDFFSIIK